ncbi:metallophosphoesterase [uncultured Polaribacter sp.]|uniref:metallophosphoesterase n=1 Tax=uncultured Polaribacter sp. TaxID=174711 RepID=UPI002611CB2A|nr:metallophosphoesterase [uncultured Polaribacter sp.]
MKIIQKTLVLLLVLLLVSACATLKMQVAKDHKFVAKQDTSEILHSFYLIGDAGNSNLQERDTALSYLAEELKKAKKNSTLVFLGDNVYEKGIPKKSKKEYKLAKHRLKVQTDLGKNFIGKTLIIPGNHDWYSGLKGLKRQEKLVEKALGKNTFQPENGCPLEKIEINEHINIIVIDSHWYITNWNKHPGINDDCAIKTRAKFFDELKGMLKKSQGKTTLVALHHPIFTNGPHGGYYSFKSHLKPIPILGTLKNVLRKTGGTINTDQQHTKYNELRKLVLTLAQQNEKIIFVSGHEHSLQYIVKNNIPQIVSGSGSKKSATKNVNGGIFSYGTEGFAKLDIYKNGASKVQFYAAKDQKVVFETNVFQKDSLPKFTKFPNAKLTVKEASIYEPKEANKSKIFDFLWGKRFRKYYGKKIIAPTVNLDTLYGGLTPIRKGGGNQSKSLRLLDKYGREYVMRALRKNAVQYIQAVAFKNQYIAEEFTDTFTEDLLLDIYTGSHPYAPFTIDKLAEAIDVYHTKPILFYVPKQKGLQAYNADFGNELYMIEERTADNHGDKKNFGFANKIISTDDLRKNLAKDEKYQLDETAYIRARLFDMLIGDWDRHQDQWRWAEFKNKDKIIYKPVPRDRDQAFSVFSDGPLLNIITAIIPALKGMRSYTEDLKKPENFNIAGYSLDMRFIKEADKKIWDEQVKLIQNNITDQVIESAFAKIPTEINDKTTLDIKRKLKGRRKNLQNISDKYFKYLNQFQVITGTNKDDYFDIERFSDNKTKITGYRIKNGEKGLIFHERTYSRNITKEIWVYGLDDKDVFVVNGKNGKSPIKIKIIGGLNSDVYEINTPKNIRIYDQKTKKNTFQTKKISKKLTDNYNTNTYNYRKLKSKTHLIAPAIGYNPDDGLKLGIKNTFIINNLEQNPFSQKHTITGAYFFATNGYELKYNGEFANVIKNFNLGFNAQFNSPNYATNFFGYGNNSFNPEAENLENIDFNRVKIEQLKLGSFLQWKGELGARFLIGANFQRFTIENTPNRFLEEQFGPENSVFNTQNFFNVETSYTYNHTDNLAFPTLALSFKALLGHTRNIAINNNFSYANTALGVTHKLTPNGKLVLATKVDGYFTFGENFEFYQAPSIGANNGLRGYRNERFTGKNAFYQTTDIRYNLKDLKTAIIPIHLGIFAGFDYGTVWGTPNILTVLPWENQTFNTSYGGGFILNAANMLTGNLGVFNSDDGLRINFTLGFDF